ncbi:(d)CMP kinase [Helcococcus sueciensis]|uniref:(d)CMP kinase n=1 Tax=Helcococcus sueciensis TaxID=241555 RepID=UPI0004271C4D|nr:(d)CMP kinase [Helcococcus sueciensis]
MYKSIAIDGPSGAGKSTIAKRLAEKIKFNYLDTGAMYRTYTYYYLKNNLDINDEKVINDNIKNINISIKDSKFYLDGEDVSEIIRGKDVTKNVSLVSSYKKIRENLVEMQRNIAKNSNIILDGRDIGSHVLKNADMKFFLTAKAEERARRRLEQSDNPNLSFESVLNDIIRRDEFDSNRKITPLIKADDAILIDSTNLSIEEVIKLMINYLEESNVI